MRLEKLPPRLFARFSPKAEKGKAYGFLNAILYLAPHEYAGVGNLCPHASPACAAACLGLHSGQASMVKSEKKKDANNVRKSRANKARHFMLNRAAFMTALAIDVARNYRHAKKQGWTLACRLNGSSDIAFEGVALTLDADTCAHIARLSHGELTPAPGRHANIFAAFPSIQFLDYTKNPARMRRALPSNYHLTFSRAESNQEHVDSVLAMPGKNIAAVFESLPDTWQGRTVINGDSHDLRFLDPPGVIVGLTPKGPKAKRDKSGFVIRAELSQ